MIITIHLFTHAITKGRRPEGKGIKILTLNKLLIRLPALLA